MAMLGKRKRGGRSSVGQGARKRRGRVTRKTVARIPRRISNQPIISLQRQFYFGNWTPSSTGVSNYWKYFTFTLQDLPSHADFTNVFDRFRINAIKVSFRPRYDNFAGNDTVDTTAPGVTAQGTTRMSVVLDPASNVNPAGIYSSSVFNQFLENGRARQYAGTRDINVYFKPMTNSEVGGASAGRRVRAPMLQTNNGLTIVHNGFHAFAHDINFTGTFNQAWDIFVTYYLTFAGLRQ